MRLNKQKIRRTGTLESEFIIINHFIQYQNNESPILSFIMDYTDINNAQKLGKKISSIVNECKDN